MKQDYSILLIILTLLVFFLVRNYSKENFWHGWRRRWFYNRPYVEYSDAYLNCIRNHSNIPNKDEKCCHIVFGTSCNNI